MAPDQTQAMKVALPISEETPLVAPDRKNNTSGYLYMLSCALIVAVGNFLTQIAEIYYSVPIPVMMLIRGTLIFLFTLSSALTFLTPLDSLRRLSRRDKVLLCIRGLSGAVGKLLMLVSLRHLAYGHAMTIYLTNPVLTLLLSHLIISEPLTIYDVIAGLVSLLGVALITLHFGAPVAPGANQILGVVCAVASAVLGALAFTLVRVLGNKIHFMMSTLTLASFSVLCAVGLGGVLPISEIVRLKDGIVISLGAAVLAVIAQCCLDKGLQNCRAGPGTLIGMVQVPGSYALGITFLNQVPSWRSVGGSCLVLVAAAVVGIRQIADG